MSGSWVGEEQLSPSPFGPGGPATGRFNMRVDVDGLFLIQDYAEEKEGKTVFRGHGMVGWDEQQKSYVWYWVDSMGTTPASPSRGHWQGDALVFEHSPVGDQRARYTYTLAGDSALGFRIESSHDAGRTWTKLIEGHYHRG
jgi:hypothetical protein